jgi:hypothetical protein
MQLYVVLAVENVPALLTLSFRVIIRISRDDSYAGELRRQRP